MVTVVALPFVLSENRRNQDERPSAVAAVGADVAGALRASEKATTSSTEARLNIAYLPSEVTGAAPTTVPPATPPTDPPTVLEGKASFDRWAPGMVATDRPCKVAFPVERGTTVNVTNLDNGHVTTCLVVERDTLPAGQIIVIDSRVFGDLADLAESPIPVRVDW